MSSNFAPPADSLVIVDGYLTPMKFPLPTAQRSFPSGSPLWNNGSGGVEPALQLTGDSTSIDHANAALVLAGLVGFAGERRNPQSYMTLGHFGVPGDAVASPEDASPPFITAFNGGTIIGPCAALGAQHEVGEYVQLDGFQNEASTGFYGPDGVLRQDTLYYLYDNKVRISTTQDRAHSIGILCERALAGQTFLKFSPIPSGT